MFGLSKSGEQKEILFKMEDSKSQRRVNPTVIVGNLEALTTVANAWQVLTF
jgi:hypothetical protein